MADSDSGTGSESEREEMIVDRLKHMTKEEIYHCVKKSGCPMLAGRRLLHLKKDVLISYLERKKCPMLEKLILASQKSKE
jgi:hypothetical protein